MSFIFLQIDVGRLLIRELFFVIYKDVLDTCLNFYYFVLGGRMVSSWNKPVIKNSVLVRKLL